MPELPEVETTHLEEGATLHIIHGSTVATNAALEGQFARTALVCNYGMGDMLSLARQTRPELYALHVPPRDDPVAQEMCLETGGRLGADGATVEPLGPEELDKLLPMNDSQTPVVPPRQWHH